MSKRRPRLNAAGPSQRRSGAAKPPRDPSAPALNKYNGYKCPACGQAWLSVDLDEGVTPMFSPCFGTENCRGTAFSMGYPEGPPPNLPLLIEWYRPMHAKNLSYEMSQHIRQGGLMRRATMTAPEWVRRIA